MKKVLHLSSVDYGGAGKVATDYNDFLIEKGYNSKLIVLDKKRENSSIAFKKNTRHKILSRLLKSQSNNIKFRKEFLFYNKNERFTITSTNQILKQSEFIPEIIILHWVSGFINAKNIRELQIKTNATIIWLLIDNAPLTGGCHYPIKCEGYKTECNNCPAIITSKAKINAAKNLKFKLKHLPENIKIASFSTPDRIRAEKSALYNNIKIHMLYGHVNENLYKPLNHKVENNWNLPANKKILLFGASDLNDKRKGLSILIDILNKINSVNIHYLVIGKLGEEIPFKNYTATGLINETELIKAFQLSYAFLSPSTEDSGPMMINLSMMCGLPVVSFDIGVANDLVINGETGFKSELENSNGFLKGIETICNLNKEDYSKMRENCRRKAIELYGKEAFGKQFEEIMNYN